MKAKPIPTSPKSLLEDDVKEDAVEAFLKEPQVIAKPSIVRFSSTYLVITVIISFLAGIVGSFFIMFGQEQWPWLKSIVGNTNSEEISVIKSVSKKESSITNYAEVVKNISPNVVSIYVRQTPVRKNAALLDQLYLPSDRRGIGTLLTEDGLGVTTLKAIPDLTKEIAVITEDKTVYLTKDFITDPASDLVLFRISGKGFPVVDFADSAGLIVPQTVLDVGRQTTSQSINAALTDLISLNAKRVNSRTDLIESSERYYRFYQTRSSIETPGLPVFSLGGKLVGVHSGTDGDVIPASIISTAFDRLNKTGKITRNVFGVKYLDLQTAKGLLISPAEVGDTGALITSDDLAKNPAVDPKGPAGRAGLKSGDVILKVNDISVSEDQTLSEIIQSQTAHSAVTVVYRRDEAEQNLPVTLDITSE